jgi:hypothetical protein
MGLDKWDDFYMKKAGSSTMDMSRMNEIFGEAALHRNEKLSKGAKPAVRNKVEKLRKLMADFAGNAVDLGYNIDGGGTIWAPVSASVHAHTELVLYAVLGGKAPAAKHFSVSTVHKQVDVLSPMIVKEHADKDAAGYFKFADAKVSLAKMRLGLKQIAAEATSLDRANSDRVLSFCDDYAKLAKGDWG